MTTEEKLDTPNPPSAGEALRKSDIEWLRGAKDVGHCGEGTMERRARDDHNDRIDRLLRAVGAQQPPAQESDMGKLTKARVLIEAFGDDERPWRVTIAKPDRSVWGQYSTRELAVDAAHAAHAYYAATERGVEPLAGLQALSEGLTDE